MTLSLVDSLVDTLAAPMPGGKKRDLGGAVLLAAIEDYRCLNNRAHVDAERFLYPVTEDDCKDFAWVVSITDVIDRRWLRDALDERRKFWDVERMRRQRARA